MRKPRPSPSSDSPAPRRPTRRRFLGQAAAALAALAASRSARAQRRPTIDEVAADPARRKERRMDALAELKSDRLLRGGDIIRVISRTLLNVDRESVGQVVDAFWKVIQDPAHYQGTGKGGTWLVVAHFGTFYLNRGRLEFYSRKRPVLREYFGCDAPPAGQPQAGEKKNPFVASFLRLAGKPHPRWIRNLEAGKEQHLSVKRRLAVAARKHLKDMELETVDSVLWEFFNLLGRIFADGSHDIHWRSRGCMEFQERYDRYRLRPYRQRKRPGKGGKPEPKADDA